MNSHELTIPYLVERLDISDINFLIHYALTTEGTVVADLLKDQEDLYMGEILQAVLQARPEFIKDVQEFVLSKQY